MGKNNDILFLILFLILHPGENSSAVGTFSTDTSELQGCKVLKMQLLYTAEP